MTNHNQCNQEAAINCPEINPVSNITSQAKIKGPKGKFQEWLAKKTLNDHMYMGGVWGHSGWFL